MKILIILTCFISISISNQAQVVDDKLKYDMNVIPISNKIVLVLNDELKLINKDFILNRPELYVVNKRNYYYLIAPKSNCGKSENWHCDELFVYHEPTSLLKQITNEGFNEIYDKFVFRNNLYYLFYKGNDKILSSGIILVPESSPLTYKSYLFMDLNWTWIDDVKIVDDKLQIGVIVKDTHLQWEYYVLFFLPRERPAKWGHDKIYKYNYTFDKDLNLISKKLVKTYKK